jgi:hypothetical protein
MKRSTGVTVAAIVLLLGSALELLLTAFTTILMFWISGKTYWEPIPTQLLVLDLVGAAFIACVDIFGIITAIGLLRLKNWARITTIVFGVIIAAQSLLSAIVILVIPLPTVPNSPAHIDAIIRATMAGGCLFFFAIGLWWLILFTRRGVREQFKPAPVPIPAEISASAAPIPTVPIPAVPVSAPKPGRLPVVVLVVAIFLLAGTPAIFIVPLLHFPAFFLGKAIYGRTGELIYVPYFLIQLILGIGLLRLKRWSLPATIAFYIFGIFNAATMFFGSGREAYIAAVLRTMPMPPTPASMPPGFPFSTQEFAFFMDLGGVIGILFCLVLTVLLLRARPAFNRAARERAAAVSPSSSF